MLQIGFEQAKSSFFTVDKIIAQMDKAERQALSRIGAFVRRRALSSIRRRKSISQPGSPPSAHGDSPLKKFLYFVYDPNSRSVVIGPTIWGKGASAGQNPLAPEILEFGGVVSAVNEDGTRETRKYQPRPFMAPALLAEVAAGTMPEQLRGSLPG